MFDLRRDAWIKVLDDGREYRTFAKSAGKFTVIVCGLFVCLGAIGHLLLITNSSKNTFYDFYQEWTSAQNYLNGYPVYTDLAKSTQLHVPTGRLTGIIKYNAHPPASILVALPMMFW